MSGRPGPTLLWFALPATAALAAGLPYVLSGRLRQALLAGPGALDILVWLLVAGAVLIPPALGWREARRLAQALEHHADAARKRAEKEYQERLAGLLLEKAHLDAILRHMADGILLVDQQRRIILMNPAAERMLGVARHEAVGRDHLEVTHHFDLDEQLARVLATGEPATLEIRRARPEHQILEARIVLAASAQERAALIMLRDITRARQLEQMRTDFVANVTHELRTPLTSIEGFAETLLEGALNEPETARRFVEIIQRESRQLAALIDELLDLARVESGSSSMRAAS